SAYLLNMAVRLKEMRRVLKDTGSIYLHCDDTAAPYLRFVMDAIFGDGNFRNEIVWKRIGNHNDAGRFGRTQDRILFYGADIRRDQCRIPLSDENVSSKYRHEDGRGKYRRDNLTGPGVSEGESGQSWRGWNPTEIGRCWSVPKTGDYAAWIEKNIIPGYRAEESVIARLDMLHDAGLIAITGNGTPELKRYLAANPGQVPPDVWTDIPPVNSQARERLGYPTQKPVALLERIIRASSDPGDIVLDPFCGCGTTVHAAETLNRRWIGIDISRFSVGLIRNRIIDNFKKTKSLDHGAIPVIGCPLTVHDAWELAERDKFEFEKWACGAVGAQGLFHAPGERGADGGVDGIIPFYYHESTFDQTPENTFAVVQVKGGKVQPDSVKALSTTVRESGGKCGVMICFDRYMTTVDNNREKGRISHPHGHFNFIQGLSVENLVAGKMPDLPLARYAA
ncbi:MAG: site-specific DNA-methyltransferase, partial [Gammaproteobacteria bacterium]|nr:site-specific DNA-methyltransferase [Gammaproteobacteria bacterium]